MTEFKIVKSPPADLSYRGMFNCYEMVVDIIPELNDIHRLNRIMCESSNTVMDTQNNEQYNRWAYHINDLQGNIIDTDLLLRLIKHFNHKIVLSTTRNHDITITITYNFCYNGNNYKLITYNYYYI